MKKELYRIKKGKVFNEKVEIPFDFGIVFVEDGIISTDLYVAETFDLNENEGTLTGDSVYNANCITDEGNPIEIHGLDIKTIFFDKGLIDMVCFGSLHYTDKKTLPPPGYKETDDTLHYLEIEGLEMEYCEATTHERNSRSQGNLGGTKYMWDRTTIGWSSNQSLCHVDFSKNHENGNVIVKFDNSCGSIQTLSNFRSLKRDFVSLLSFLSGAEINIRKECFGNYYTEGKAEAEKGILYSFKKVVHNRHNHYIPLNDAIINRSANILNKVMIGNFDKFREWNTKIDLTSIIYYLNGAVQTRTLEEQFFILIIAFERLTTIYAEQTGPSEVFHPSSEDFGPIKQELFQVLDRHKGKFGKYFGNAKSDIGNLNQVKRLSTKDKMYGILNDVGIEVSDDLVTLIDIVRHKAVHKGEIGENNDGLKNTMLLNELIHEIILKLVNYQGPRRSYFLHGQGVVIDKLN